MIILPEFNPVAAQIGPLAIRWYALAYVAGFILGLAYVKRYLPPAPQRPNYDDLQNAVTWAILGTILGGRLGYVLFYNLPMYLEHPADILHIWQGGMSFHGGMLGVITAAALYTYFQKIRFLSVMDYFAAATPIGLGLGRLANFVNGELFGRVTDVPWGMVFPHGGPLPRHPSQLYETGLEGFVLFTVLWLMIRQPRMRAKPGMIGGAFLVGYALCRIIVEQFREPDAQLGFMFGSLTMGQLLSAPMIVFGLWLILRPRKHVTLVA